MPPLRVASALLYGFFLRCPRCHKGRLFRRRFQMRIACPLCDLWFERASGEITGGMGINAVVTCLLMVTLALVFAFTPRLPVGLAIIALIIVGGVFPIVFYRSSRGLWVSFLYLTGNHDEPD